MKLKFVGVGKEPYVEVRSLRKKLKDRLKENNKKYYEWAEKVKKNPDDHYKQGKCWKYEGCCEEDRNLLAELEKEVKS